MIKKTIENGVRFFSPFYRNSIAVNWHVSENFGDVLSVYIAKKLSGMDVKYVTENSNYVHYHIIGSLLSLANKNSIVWGTGFAYKTDSFIQTPKKVYMVRGEYSLEICRKLGVEGDVTLGDPGYMLSRLYQPNNLIKKYKIGVIPHWVDYELCNEIFKSREDVHVVNLLNSDVEAVIDQIYSCEQCLSSSLHGLVVAHSYDVPCIHVNFSDCIMNTGLKKYSIAGDGVKFIDYFSSVCIQEYGPTEIKHPNELDDIITSIPINCGDKNQIDRMIASCPFIKVVEHSDAYY